MEWLETAWSWVKDRDTLFAWIGGLSLFTLIASAIAVPILIRRMPSDYFLENDPKAQALREEHPALRISFLVVKNLVGAILLVGGILMLITPGQGLLTIMIGLMLMDFPGKRKLEIRLVRFGPLNRGINWIRERAGKEPLELPAERA